MTRQYRPWTDEEYEQAKRMRNAGASFGEIGEVLGRKSATVHARLSYERKPSCDNGFAVYERYGCRRASPEAIEQQHYRNGLQPRDLTAAIMGDPLPGYSALDRR